MDIFIQQEKIFFSHILNTSKNISEENKAQWRKETIHQRKIRINNSIYEKLSGKVKYGPFKGMILDHDSWWNRCDIGSMLLGAYETPVISSIFSKELSHLKNFINLGAADGYYAIGGLRSTRFQKCVAFESERKGRDLILNSAIKNEVNSQLVILSEANKNFFKQIPTDINLKETLFLIDIEGAEFDILNDESLSKLKNSSFIIEIHNWIPDFWEKYQSLLKKASKFFNVSSLKPEKINIDLISELDTFSDDSRYLLLSEGRPNQMRFLKLTPKL